MLILLIMCTIFWGVIALSAIAYFITKKTKISKVFGGICIIMATLNIVMLWI